MRRILKCLGFFLSITCTFAVVAAPLESDEGMEPLDRTLKPDAPEEDLGIFQDTVVVQHRAMPKAGRFLISSYGALDFSDGPYSMYAFQLNPGYAISDFWEVYLNFAPFYISSARSIVSLVESHGFEISAAKPQRQFGFEVLWAPAYGKDSIGSHHVIRSDTFFKLGVTQITYDQGSGMKFHSAFGKTYFLGRHVGFRPAVSANYVQTIVDGVKSFHFIAIVEAGLVLYF